MRLNQVWIIMNNGICPIHILYKGQMLEENLFAAFVRALFSFSKDMSGDKSISSMTLGDMNIHYLAEENEKFFVAISAEVGISQEDIDLYLEFISSLFMQYYPEYIEKIPPFEPESFTLFRESIDFFIRYTESKFLDEIQGIKDIDLGLNLESIQFSQDHVVIQSSNDQILRIIKKSDLTIKGTYYPEEGSIKHFIIQRNDNYIIILSELNDLTIIPFSKELDDQFITKIKNDIVIAWFTIHPSKPIIFFGNEEIINEYNLVTKQQTNYKTPESITQLLVGEKDNVIIKTLDSTLFSTTLPLRKDLVLSQSIITDKVHSILSGPSGLMIIVCLNQLVHLWDGEHEYKTLVERYPNNTSISYSQKKKIIFLITEYNEFLIHDSDDTSLLVNYNLVEPGFGAFVSENDHLVIVYS